MERSMEVPKKIKSRITTRPSIPLLDIPKEMKEERDLHAHVDSSFIHSSWYMEATQVSTDRRMDKQNVACAYTLALKRKTALQYTTTLMDLEDMR